MVAVKVANVERAPHFALGLTNGRRIECSWRFADAELARLITATGCSDVVRSTARILFASR